MKKRSDLDFDERHNWQAAPGEQEPAGDDHNTQSTDDDDEFEDDADADEDDDEDDDDETEQEDAEA